MNQIIEFSEASDRAVAGGKGFGLHRLSCWNLNVPPGFVVSSDAYRDALASLEIDPSDSNFDADSVSSAIIKSEFPDGLEDELEIALGRLEDAHGAGLRVSCRSSATAEDSATASFAGQFATVLGVAGLEGVIDAIKECWASIWSPEAVSYRGTNGIGHQDVSMAVVVQKMVNAVSSGVAFSVNPVTGNANEVMINSNWGLGETVVSGLVTPDTFLVGKADRSITAREISQTKNVSHVVTGEGSIEEVNVGSIEAISSSLTDEQILEVASLAADVEDHAGSPQDLEWAYEAGELFVLQTRPITTI